MEQEWGPRGGGNKQQSGDQRGRCLETGGREGTSERGRGSEPGGREAQAAPPPARQRGGTRSPRGRWAALAWPRWRGTALAVLWQMKATTVPTARSCCPLGMLGAPPAVPVSPLRGFSTSKPPFGCRPQPQITNSLAVKHRCGSCAFPGGMRALPQRGCPWYPAGTQPGPPMPVPKPQNTPWRHLPCRNTRRSASLRQRPRCRCHPTGARSPVGAGGSCQSTGAAGMQCAAPRLPLLALRKGALRGVPRDELHRLPPLCNRLRCRAKGCLVWRRAVRAQRARGGCVPSGCRGTASAERLSMSWGCDVVLSRRAARGFNGTRCPPAPPPPAKCRHRGTAEPTRSGDTCGGGYVCTWVVRGNVCA